MFELVTGGSGSGKSEYAENRALSLHREYGGELLYIATMAAEDSESQKKIARHRNMRKDKGFVTIERYTDLKNLIIPEKSVVMLDCLSNLLANEMYSENGAGELAAEEITAGIERLLRSCLALVTVTNEVFSDGLEYDEETIRYIKNLGIINRSAALLADTVTEVVYSVPVRVKGRGGTC